MLVLRVDAVRHTMEPVPGCVGNTACCTKPCAARNNTKPGDGSKQVQLYSPSCTTIWHRCAYSDGWTHQTDAAGTVPCDGMLHKPCAYGSIQNSLQTAAADHLSCKPASARMYACLFACVDAVKHTQQAVPGCVGLRTNPVQAVTTQQPAASSKHLHKNKTGCPAC
jgi:hypothetical protein